jgi:hypothetical protein
LYQSFWRGPVRGVWWLPWAEATAERARRVTVEVNILTDRGRMDKRQW